MCGIAGTIFKSDYNRGCNVSVKELSDIVTFVQNGEASVEKLLEICWRYKSNVNLLRYFREDKERKSIRLLCARIKELCNKCFAALPLIDKRRFPQKLMDKYKEYEQLMDCNWFLSTEINNWHESIKYLANDEINNLSDVSLVFYKNLISVINAIDNRLEIRGRDSLGLSIQLFSRCFDEKVTKSKNSHSDVELFYYEKCGKYEVASFVFKTAKLIGSLGDNALEIKELIRRNNILKQAVSMGELESGTIVAHTRWASVGEVSVHNCHPICNAACGDKLKYPLIMASLNGDIYNYNEIISSKKESVQLTYDERCSSDCLAIPLSLTYVEPLHIESIKRVFRSYVGSFAIAVQGSALLGQIILSNRGSQGLYVGMSYDNVMFASDVYGLVENCKYFYPVKSGSILSLDVKTGNASGNCELDIHGLDSDDITLLNKNSFKTTNITTRDIDKKGHHHFLKKEIYETKDIVQRTILGYLQAQELIDEGDYHNAIIIEDTQVPKHIIEKLKNGKINNVVITGMGTCYTASVAIARYMRDMLRMYFKNIRVEPHVASEGSAFYLKPQMDDTLVIVIAQSGTTVDTNVYVQMAKERGAVSLAIANKREGDVTFIVDGTLYIGSGRDIEMAVPSTKTYTAQVVLGYVLTLYFCSKLNEIATKKHDMKNDIELLRNIPELIDDTFEHFDDKNMFDKIRSYTLKHNSWYLVYDDSPNSVCAMEIRIKYSECCYHSLPYLHIDELLKCDVKNSFITYISNEKLIDIKENMLEMLDRGNVVIAIIPHDDLPEELRTYKDSGKLFLKNIPFVEPSFSFLPTIIAGQFLSYYAAVALDERKEYFGEMSKSIERGDEFDDKWAKYVFALKDGMFNQGFSVANIHQLESLYKNAKESGATYNLKSHQKLTDYLQELYQFSRRPIDTIKHQAKTITVGAVRDRSLKFAVSSACEENTVFFDDGRKAEIDVLCNEIMSYEDKSLGEKLKIFRDVFIYMNDMDESYGYNIVGYLNEFSNVFNLDIRFKLAHNYDLQNMSASCDSFWFFICKDHANIRASHFPNLGEKQYAIYDYLAGKDNATVRRVPNLHVGKCESINYALGSLYIASVIAKTYCCSNKRTVEWRPYFHKKLNQLKRSWDYLKDSDKIDREIENAAKTYLSRRNWKCVGSGVNYNVAKFMAKKIILDINRSCAFDVLENHKHIDMSAEGAILTFIANIWRHGYQEDAMSEIEKLISHGNIPIIITNCGDDRFDDMRIKVNYGRQEDVYRPISVIKLPKVSEAYSFPLNMLLINKFVDELIELSNMIDNEIVQKIALSTPSEVAIRQ